MLRARSRRKNSALLLATLWILMLVASLSLLVTFLRPFSSPLTAQTFASLDWSGYSVTSDLSNPQPVVTGVSGSWTVPKVTVSQTDAFSATWVGIGGQLDETLIQTGTEHDSINGTEAYSVWYELLPSISVTIGTVNISPGDKITASIKLVDSATSEWTIEIADITNGQSFQENIQYDSSRLSAEWIVERPTVDHSLSVLADFGSATFTTSSATIQDNVGSIKAFPYAQIIMQDRQNRALVTVSPLSSDGSSFTVTYSNGQASTQSQLNEPLENRIATKPTNDLKIHPCPDSKANMRRLFIDVT